jgi:hypothetical protein
MKSSKTTVRQRVEEILNLLLLGAVYVDIRRHAAEQKWGVCSRQLQRYIAQANKRIAAALDSNRGQLLAFHFSAHRALYARAMAVSDYGTAFRVLRDEGELFGLYPPKQTAVSLTPLQSEPVETNDDDRLDGINALIARVGSRNGRPVVTGSAYPARSALGPPRRADDQSGDGAGPMAECLAALNG